MNSEKQVHPGSKMNEVEVTTVQMTLFEDKFCLIYVHVSWVSVLYICCGDVSKNAPSYLLV